MSLYSRLHPESDRRIDDLTPIREQRSGDDRREPSVPTWIKRMQDGELKGKDMTGRIAA